MGDDFYTDVVYRPEQCKRKLLNLSEEELLEHKDYINFLNLPQEERKHIVGQIVFANEVFSKINKEMISYEKQKAMRYGAI